MAFILNNQNIASWRPINYNRPWYEKALSIFPVAKKLAAIDLGSGSGEFPKIIKPLVKKLIVADYSQKYVEKLNQMGLKAVQADFNRQLPFKNKQFALAIALEVIEHLFNHELFLSEINRILTPNGYLLISTPNIVWWGYRWEALLGRPPKKTGYHFRFFTHHTLVKLLQENGFKVIKSAGFSTVPLLNRWLIWFKLKPIYPVFKFCPNLLVQDLVFLCRKK